MTIHQPIDIDDRELLVGDWVRVILAPLSIQGMPLESLEAFSRAIGHTFQIEEIEPSGCLHLDMYPKISFDSIYIESFCVRRFQRYKKLSKAFQKRLDNFKSFQQKARLEIEFEAYLKPGADLEAFGLELVSLGTGGGFAVWLEKSKVKGTITVEVDDPNAYPILNSIRTDALKITEVETIEVSEIRQRNEI